MAHDAILRLPSVKQKSGLARSTIYKLVAAGVWTRPIHIAARAVGWPNGEVEDLLAARIAGRTDDEIRALVVKLEAARRTPDNRVV